MPDVCHEKVSIVCKLCVVLDFIVSIYLYLVNVSYVVRWIIKIFPFLLQPGNRMEGVVEMELNDSSTTPSVFWSPSRECSG